MHGQERRALVAEVSTRVSYVYTIARYAYSRHYACTVPTYYIIHYACITVGTVHAYTIPEVWLIDLSLSLSYLGVPPPHAYRHIPIPCLYRHTYG